MMYMFSYGMNTNKMQMATRCPAAKPIGAAVLAGHRFRFAGCADVVPDRHRQVDGVLWSITAECQQALDWLEGYPSYYNSKTVLVQHRQQFYEAEMYFMNPGHENWPPSQSYYNTIVEGYKSFNVPLHQVKNALQGLTEHSY